MGRSFNCFLALMENWNDLFKRILIMRDMNVLLSMYTMFVHFAVLPEQILSLVEIIDSDFVLHNFHREKQLIIDEKKTRLLIVEKKILDGNIFCITGMTVMSLITSCYIYFVTDQLVVTDLQLPYPFYFPKGYENIRVYFLAYAIDAVITVFLVFATSYCYFSTTILAIERVSIDFDLLRLSMEKINEEFLGMKEEEEEMEEKERMRSKDRRREKRTVERCFMFVLSYHQDLLRKSKKLQKNSQFVLLVAYQLTCFFDVGNFYCFYKTNDIKMRIMLVIITVLANLLLFYTCDSGQRMIDASERARESMYSFVWQNKPKSIVKNLFTMMIRANKDVHVQPFGLYTLQHRTFANTDLLQIENCASLLSAMSSPDKSSQPPAFQKPLDPKFATKACLVGQHPEQWGYNDAVPPICLASTYKQMEPGVAKFDYSRSGNPNREVLENCLASLDDAKYGLCFASGLGTLTAVMSLLESGDHILCVDDLYGGTFRYFKHIASRFKLESSFLDASDPEKFVASMQPNTKIIWLESPTNPLLKVWDIEKICQLAKAKSKDVIVIVDNTFLTPYYQRPLELGADIALYSVTKYLNGHSDVVMGSLAVNDKELYERLKFIQNSCGIVPSPFDCFLVNRSLKTLHLRMNEHMKSGLPSHPHHQLALRQWSGCSGMVSFYHKYGLNESKKFLKSLKVFMLAESLGGYESLAELPSVMTHASVPEEIRAVLGITDNFIRLSVGLSSVQDLIEDLDQALRGMTKN
ncbi:hypothetical protein LSTR_LSTR007099 [Laodelphax striatellus]|uniref:cystathionine gamma-lyase n=1 Tax=Laodelphax striatellus TaxID=195883 RepID=A0A482WFQ3_LAOST|nr:hypothetical protein LSTR_LSTR007099 [Laodelphax striatellus]